MLSWFFLSLLPATLSVLSSLRSLFQARSDTAYTAKMAHCTLVDMCLHPGTGFSLYRFCSGVGSEQPVLLLSFTNAHATDDELSLG